MSINMMTPSQATACEGEIKKWWISYRVKAIKEKLTDWEIPENSLPLPAVQGLTGKANKTRDKDYKSTNISYKLNQSQLLSEIGSDRSQPKLGNDTCLDMRCIFPVSTVTVRTADCTGGVRRVVPTFSISRQLSGFLLPAV